MPNVTDLQLLCILLIHHELNLGLKFVLIALGLLFKPHYFVFVMVDKHFKLVHFVRKFLDFRFFLHNHLFECHYTPHVVLYLLVLGLVAVFEKNPQLI